jgi:tripartite-type tricarboxylate transporter receptor subunit TctC
MVIVLRPNFPASSLADFVKLAKENPGKFSYATPGRGTPQHFGAEMFCAEAGIRMNHVPYRGAAPAMQDIISDQVDLFFGTETSAGPFIAGGKMKALAGTLNTRLSQFPDVKTLPELGFHKSEIGIWYGLFGPPNLPAAVIEKLTGALAIMKKKEEYDARLRQLALTNDLSTSGELKAQIALEVDKWREVARIAGIKPE